MGKKYKSKSVATQKKKGNVTASKEGPEAVNAEASKVDVKCTETNMQSSMEEANKHLEQVAAIATMPLRLDQQIQSIKEIQKQLFQLHTQQVMLLDDCTNILQELNAIQPRNDMEEKLVLETFQEIKGKLSDVFEHFLPAQLDILKHESKMLGISQNKKPK